MRNETNAWRFGFGKTHPSIQQGLSLMRACIGFVAVGALALLAQVGPAPAKGCISGAIVGGMAGHYAAHHGFLGAAAGCVAGRHMASRRRQTTGQGTAPANRPNTPPANSPNRVPANSPNRVPINNPNTLR